MPAGSASQGPLVGSRGTMGPMESDLPTVTVRLWHADAVVLFDWLISENILRPR